MPEQEPQTVRQGLYSLQFTIGGTKAGGVVFMANGRLHGGDSGFAWAGTYSEEANEVRAQLRVFQHDRAVPSAFGGLTNFTLTMVGHRTGDTIILQGTSPSAPGTIGVHLSFLQA